MLKHVVSFLKSPVGYVLNLVASALVVGESLPVIGRGCVVVGGWVARPCDALCARDGIQDRPLFWG